MSLQDDVNDQVAAIRQQLADAQGANPPDSVTVSFGSIRAALGEVANAIDALGGDSAALRSSIDGIGDPVIDLSQVNAGAASHVGATAGLISLLVDQSNFDGAQQ